MPAPPKEIAGTHLPTGSRPGLWRRLDQPNRLGENRIRKDLERKRLLRFTSARIPSIREQENADGGEGCATHGRADRCDTVAVSEARIQAPIGHEPSDHGLPRHLTPEDDLPVGLEHEILYHGRRISGLDRSDTVVAEGRDRGGPEVRYRHVAMNPPEVVTTMILPSGWTAIAPPPVVGFARVKTHPSPPNVGSISPVFGLKRAITRRPTPTRRCPGTPRRFPLDRWCSRGPKNHTHSRSCSSRPPTWSFRPPWAFVGVSIRREVIVGMRGGTTRSFQHPDRQSGRRQAPTIAQPGCEPPLPDLQMLPPWSDRRAASLWQPVPGRASDEPRLVQRIC